MRPEEPSSPPVPPVAVLLAALALCVLIMAPPGHPDPSGVPAEGGDDGMGHLLGAAEAEDEVPYTAVGTVSFPGARQERALHVVSRPGEGVAVAPLGSQEPAFVVRESPEALDGRLLRVLADTYAVVYAGPGELEGRPVHRVDALRADGTRAGRFLVDADTGLLVGRTVCDGSGRPFSVSRLSGIRVGEADWPEHAVGGEPWGDTLPPDEREELREGGWYLPEHLAWNLRLVDARSTRLDGARVVHAVYSDGLSQVSVFLQRGKLESEHPSALGDESTGTGAGGDGVTTEHDTIFGGGTGQYRNVWESGGFVYTVLADAPTGLVSSAVTALPEPGAFGFWARVQRGLSRWGIG
ncbi:transcriptional regulator [Nocardiopsis sp. LOL_012]|uniref:transcriptional regulator n=1 Tax=Nocardiopsis sp. LOL_012 TaxID=3345409 RepID=UPI003A8AE065